MHIKHYHPDLLKKMGCTNKALSVEDLATARTAFDMEDVKQVASTQSILSAILTPSEAAVGSPARPKAAENMQFTEDIVALGSSKKLERRRKGEKRGLDTGDGLEDVMEPFDSDMLDLESKASESADGVRDMYAQSSSMLEDVPGQKELVHCFCGSPEEDGLMIQCELCLCWQHGACLSIDNEDNVPDPYVCYFCRYPYKERLSQRYTHDQSWLKKGNLPSLKFISGSSFVPADRALRVAHTLTAAATDLKQLLHSLKVKIDIAKYVSFSS